METTVSNAQKVGKFSSGCGALAESVPITFGDAIQGTRSADFINLFIEEAENAGYTQPGGKSDMFGASENKAQLLVGASISNFTENGCWGGLLSGFQNRMDAKVTVEWQVYDPLEQKTVFRGRSEGTANVPPRSEDVNDARVVAVAATREAIRNAARQILAQQEFEVAVRDPRGAASSPQAAAPSMALQIAHLPQSTKDFRTQVGDLRHQVVTVLTPASSGSGFYIAGGFLVTNNHVISGYSDVKIRFFGGREISGFVVASNVRRDVALVKTDAQSFQGLPIRLDPPLETSVVYVIGSHLGQEQEGSVSAGIVSGFRTENGLRFIQSDVGVTHGNSGGPMFDDKGNVIALTVAGKHDQEGLPTQVNLFIPIADALKTLNIDASLPAGAAPVLVSTQPGATTAPVQREIQVSMFPADGPMKRAGNTKPLAGKVAGVGTSGTFTFARPDGVSCEGRWTTLQSKPENGSLMDKHKAVLGIFQSADGMVGGLAIGACSNCASFQAEYYVVPGVDSGFGAATDSDGNVYKIIF